MIKEFTSKIDGTTFEYEVEDGVVYNKAIVFAMTKAPEILQHLLDHVMISFVVWDGIAGILELLLRVA